MTSSNAHTLVADTPCRSNAKNFPVLDSEYSLKSVQIEQFSRDGHLYLPNVVAHTEITAYRPALVDAVDRNDLEKKPMEKAVRGRRHVWQFVENLWQRDPIARQFVLARRFGKLAADLLQVDTVRLFRDQSYFKSSGGGNTPWHQDSYFLPLESSQVLTLWVALSDVTSQMAPMTFATKSHKKGYIGTSTPFDEDMDAFEHAISAAGCPLMNYQSLAAGDATVHTGWTLHSSRQNVSDRTREAMVIVYYAEGARVSMPHIPAEALPQEQFAGVIRRNNLLTSLPGLQPGDIAATHMNPIVYQR